MSFGFDKLQKTLFFLLIFSLSFQVGFHFWPKFSYVGGVRIDYLSPTLYLLDIFIFLFILLSIQMILKAKINFQTDNFIKLAFILFIFDLTLNIFLAKSPGAHILGIVKLAEFGLFGLLVSRVFKKEYILGFVRTLSLSAIVASTLAIWQFTSQSSVGGLWYYFGERTFNSSTIGISTVNFDHQILRAYGAFPHPNVLAFFLLTTIVFATLRFGYEKKLYGKVFLILTIIISSVALLSTLSRIAIFLAICFIFYAFYSKRKNNIRYFTLGFLQIVLPLIVVLLSASNLSFLFRGLDFRQELFVQSVKIFTTAPYLGIGLNNFFMYQASLIKTISPIAFQPPHDIFVLALLSLGLFGWWIVPLGLIRAVRRVWGKIEESGSMNPVRQAQGKHESRDFHKGVLFVLISIIIVGTFDHFFLTLEQGQIILALILGLSFAKIRTNN